MCSLSANQGLLTIVAHSAEASLLAKAIEFINEEDAGSIGTCPLEHVPDTGGADAHKHLHELSASCCVEGDPCLTSNGFGQQGLACITHTCRLAKFTY